MDGTFVILGLNDDSTATVRMFVGGQSYDQQFPLVTPVPVLDQLTPVVNAQIAQLQAQAAPTDPTETAPIPEAPLPDSETVVAEEVPQ
jgi:hypothetical protein